MKETTNILKIKQMEKNIISKEDYINSVSYDDQFVGFKKNTDNEIEGVLVLTIEDLEDNKLTIQEVKELFNDFSFFREKLGEEISLEADSHLKTIQSFINVEYKKSTLNKLKLNSSSRSVKGGDGRELYKKPKF